MTIEYCRCSVCGKVMPEWEYNTHGHPVTDKRVESMQIGVDAVDSARKAGRLAALREVRETVKKYGKTVEQYDCRLEILRLIDDMIAREEGK